jgi:hypothetical protein
VLETITDRGLRQAIVALLRQDPTDCCLLVAEGTGGVILGGLALIKGQHFLTGEPFADDVGWGVHPEYRTTLAGPALLAAGEAWACSQGLRFIHMTAPLQAEQASSFPSFYANHGYVPIETSYVKELR